jgi:hypothetical protein
MKVVIDAASPRAATASAMIKWKGTGARARLTGLPLFCPISLKRAIFGGYV